MFNPFLGGKRVCLGKTFAETVIRFTVPLLYFHFDFEVVNKDYLTKKPHYTLGGYTSPVFDVKFITKNLVK